MTQPPDLEARVLAGGADRDVSEMRTEIRDFREQNTRMFNAMREDFSDLRSHVDNGFAEIRGRLDATAAGQQQIVDMLNTLIEQRDQWRSRPVLKERSRGHAPPYVREN